MRQNSRAAEFLSEHGWLSFTPPEFRDKVLRRVVLHKFNKGQTVYRAGDEPGGLWAIVEGAVEISGASPGAVPHLIHFGVPGFWVGEAPLIYGIRRIVTVTAVRPSKLVTLPLADCRAILEEDPGAWRWIALQSAMTTDLAIGVVADLLLRDPVKRTAALLLRLSGMRSLVFPAKSPSPIYLSQEKVGSLVNLSRNSIIPVLQEFERNGYVKVSYGSIEVLDVAGLMGTIGKEPAEG